MAHRSVLAAIRASNNLLQRVSVKLARAVLGPRAVLIRDVWEGFMLDGANRGVSASQMSIAETRELPHSNVRLRLMNDPPRAFPVKNFAFLRLTRCQKMGFAHGTALH